VSPGHLAERETFNQGSGRKVSPAGSICQRVQIASSGLGLGIFDKANVHLAANELITLQGDKGAKRKELAESYHSEHEGCLVLVARQDSTMLYVWALVRTYSCQSSSRYDFG
jgi:hypothetical protein